MDSFKPYAIGERPGGYSQLRQKPRSLFGEPAWNSLAEYRRSTRVDSKMPPGMPSDVTRIDPSRPEDEALNGYTPFPKAASVSDVLGAMARLGRKPFSNVANQVARTRSALDVLNIKGVGPMAYTPPVPAGPSPDAIRSLFGGAGQRFWAQQGWNRTIPNTMANRLETFYQGTPQQSFMEKALERQRGGALFGPNSAASAEAQAARGLTGIGNLRPHLDWAGPNVKMPEGRTLAPPRITVPQTGYRGVEATGLGLGAAGVGGAGYGIYQGLQGDTPAAGSAAGSAPGLAPGSATGPGAPAAAPTAPAAPGPHAGGLGDWVAGGLEHVGRHPWAYGLGATGLGAGLLYLRHRKQQEEEERQQRLQEALLAKRGSHDDPFVKIAQACPTAAGILAYCGQQGHGEVEIRHLVIKAAGTIPGLTEEFARLFETTAALPETTGAFRVKQALGVGYPSNPAQPSPAPTPAPAPPRDPRFAALQAARPEVPSVAGGLLHAAGRAITGIPRMATGVAAAPGTTVVSAKRLIAGQADPWGPMRAAGRDIAAPVEHAYQQPVEALMSRALGGSPDAQQYAAEQATPGISAQFQQGAEQAYRAGMDRNASGPMRWINNRVGDVGSVAPMGMSLLGMGGPMGALANRAGAGMTALGVNAGGRMGPVLANAGARLAGAGQGMRSLGTSVMTRAPALGAAVDPNTYGMGQGRAEEAAQQQQMLTDAQAGRTPVQHLPSLDPTVLADLTPDHAPMLQERSQQGISNLLRQVQESGGKLDPATGRRELEGPLRDLIASRVAAGQMREDPVALVARIAKDGVSMDELHQVANMPGNEAITGGSQQPPAGRLAAAQSFFTNPETPGWQKALVGLGLPVAAIGLLSSLFGGSGLGGILMSVLGLGAAAYGAHQGGLLQGTQAGGMMNSVLGSPAGPSGPAPNAGQGFALSPAERAAFMALPQANRAAILREKLQGHPELASPLSTARSVWNSGLPGAQWGTGALIRNRTGMSDLKDEEIQALMDAHGGP